MSSGFSLAQFRVRLIFRGAFLTLAAATIAMAISVLQAEKQLSYQHYRESLDKTRAQILAKLHHPSGQLALFNPELTSGQITPLRPLLLPFAAIDFDDRYKVQQAIEMAGCSLHYPKQASACTAVGNNPWSGGYIYMAGAFISYNLVPKPPRSAQFELAHRMHVTLNARAQTWRWIAPFELTPPVKPVANKSAEPAENNALEKLDGTLVDTEVAAPKEQLPASRPSMPSRPRTTAGFGRLTGFAMAEDHSLKSMLPVRDFRGWIWQELPCLAGEIKKPTESVQVTGPIPNSSPSQTTTLAQGETPLVNCPRRTFFSIRLPVEMFNQTLLEDPSNIVWPPKDLAAMRIHLQMWGPKTPDVPSGEVLFDSNAPGATPPFALSDLQSLLLPGESLEIRKSKQEADANTPVAQLKGELKEAPITYPRLQRLVNKLIRRLPQDSSHTPLHYSDTIATAMGEYQLTLRGDERTVDRALAAVASRIAWYVGAMLLALLLAEIVIELSIIRRIALLTRRANAVAQSVHELQQIGQFKLNDLRGNDELGILAGCLSDLLQRIDDDVRRAQIRAAQEKDMWHAVGHEIMSPLQSLLALHDERSNSHRYLLRMQQAIKVLYGSASPSEALQSSHLQLASVNLSEFLQQVAINAPSAGINQVEFIDATQGPLWVRADEYSLEDVITHVLTNANHFRTAGSVIQVQLNLQDNQALVSIFNQGPGIAPEHLNAIFEYGVSTAQAAGNSEHRGQGLFVARTYMAKMGGRIWAENTEDGVCIRMTLAVVARQE